MIIPHFLRRNFSVDLFSLLFDVQVSTMKCGLLPLCQEACLVGEVSYHNYQGLVVDPAERDLIAKDLGPSNKVMFLRNHGVVCCGRSIEEAFHNTYHTVLAVDTQVRSLLRGGQLLFTELGTFGIF